MKKLFHFLLIASIILSYAAGLRAQTHVQGRVVDARSEPLAYANILLLTADDSTFVKGEVADELGAFRFAGLEPGAYRCEVSMVGYPSGRSAPFQLKDRPGELALGNIVLSGAADLAEVEVVAQKALVEVRADMLVFNVSASPSASGVNGLDLLRKAPGVRVDMDNNILLLGKEGVQIHINGRPSRLSGSDLAILLQNMTSDNIEAIEIISNPSAKYDAEVNVGITAASRSMACVRLTTNASAPASPGSSATRK